MLSVLGRRRLVAVLVTVAVSAGILAPAQAAATHRPSAAFGDLPDTPAILSVLPDFARATVTWSMQGGGPQVTGFVVTATPTCPGRSTVAMDVGPDARSAIVRGLSNGCRHVVSVAARNEVGVGTASTGEVVPNAPERWLTISAPPDGAAQTSPVVVSWELGPGLAPTVGAFNVCVDGRTIRIVERGTTEVTLVLPVGSHEIGVWAMDAYSLTTAADVATVTVTAPAAVFPDVPADHRFAEPIGWMLTKGLTTGYSDGTFRPAAGIRRDALAAFLFRANYTWLRGYQAPYSPIFSDVPLDHPFYREISWLAESGIATGYPDGTFRPAALVNRDAMAAFLFRYMCGAEANSWYHPRFGDVGGDQPFAGEITWAHDHGISTGYPDGTFRPGLPISRDAMAAFLWRGSKGGPERFNIPNAYGIPAPPLPPGGL